MRRSHASGLSAVFTWVAFFAMLVVRALPVAAGEPPRSNDVRPAVEKDIAYADGGDQQKLDLYLPAKSGFATVVFIYGGGWHTGSRKSVTAIGEKLQSLGYGCALLS